MPLGVEQRPVNVVPVAGGVHDHHRGHRQAAEYVERQKAVRGNLRRHDRAHGSEEYTSGGSSSPALPPVIRWRTSPPASAWLATDSPLSWRGDRLSVRVYLTVYSAPYPSPSMLVHELSASECAEVLARTHLGRLACARDGQPYVVPIYFSFDQEWRCVYGFSLVGQKITWMRENPLVCLEVEDVSDAGRWQTVLAFGRYEELDGSPAAGEGLRRAEALLGERSRWWLPAAAKIPGRPERHAVVIYRIQIDRLTGRRTTER